ncbi:MAG: hypothetical protein PVJ34_10260 [Anaerolineae bacterium]
MGKRSIICLALLLLSLGLSAPLPAGADDGATSPIAMAADPAFDGLFKYGEWLPIWVRLENQGPDVEAEIRVRVTGGYGGTVYAAPAPLPTGSRKRIPLYVLPNPYSHELEVELLAGGDLLASQKVTIEPRTNNTYLIGFLVPGRGALSLLQGISLGTPVRPLALVDLSLEDLPDRLEGLNSFDCLVLNDVDTSALTPEQAATLDTWVHRGGRLVVGGGAGAQQAVAGLPSELLPFVPGGLAQIDSLGGLADFARAEPIRLPGPFPVSTGQEVAGRTLAGQAGVPLVREAEVGAGHVDFVALDLAAAPFDGWSGTTAFWQRLLAPGADYPSWLPSDISTRQMRAGPMSYALSNLPALDLPSLRGMGILLVVYVLLVGPVNYFFLRWRRRLHWAWVTIPVITLLFSGGTFGLGYALRGTDLIVNKIALVESLPGGGASVTSYLGLFSPAQRAYEIEVKGGGLLAPLNPDYSPWGGPVPIDPEGSGTLPGEVVFVQGEPGRVRGLAVNQWSMQTFTTETAWPDLGAITADLRLEGTRLQGTVRNGTDYTLSDAALILSTDFVHLDELAPGQEVAVTLDLTDLTNVRSRQEPIFFRLFQEEFQGGALGGPPREAELKRSVLQGLLEGSWGGTVTSVAQLKSQPGLGQGIIFLGWFDQAPPQLRVNGREPAQQSTALLVSSLPYSLGDGGQVSLPPGLLPGELIELPVEGGPCGPIAAAVYIGRGQAVVQFRLPDEVRDLQIESLQLSLGSDGGWSQAPDVAFYRWQQDDWIALDQPVMGVNHLSDVAEFVGGDGLVRVRFSAEDQRPRGCIYADLGLEAQP